ncbi:hypothetical protein [Vulcanisaeta sp. JCM 16161]|uniref:hypothetical protein n=1 Tax=Vulcanisaeta sp. JCM 16161 TaxID=1295372 RepID=UPI000A786B8B|nr:hypothetical protein [Vulcanisaeta sp. JCM 16161]
MALGICWGRRVSGSRRLECVEEVDDPRVVEETMRLINEFMIRVERHRAVLLSESATPFDNAINALGNWLQRVKAKIGEGNDEGIANLRRAMLDIGKEMLRLLKRARERWLSTYRQELEELINKLRSGGTKIIISGEPFDKDKSFTARLYTDGLAIEMARVAGSGSITMQISLTGLRGINVVVPKLFSGNRLRAMQCGLLLTDGSIDEEGYPKMGTTQLWQAIAWLTAWPGKNRMRISGLGINDGDVGVTWQLRATDHRGVFKSKSDVAEEAGRLGDEEFPTFTLYAVLGDGDVNIKKKRVGLTMGKSKLGLWRNAIKRLEGLGFRLGSDNGYAVAYTVWTSKAVELARKMLGDKTVKALIEDLAQLPDAEKPRRLMALAGMEPKHLAGHQSRLPA